MTTWKRHLDVRIELNAALFINLLLLTYSPWPRKYVVLDPPGQRLQQNALKAFGFCPEGVRRNPPADIWLTKTLIGNTHSRYHQLVVAEELELESYLKYRNV